MMKESTDNDSVVRLDKWLWAARFFKTRSLAAEAITGGKVQVDGRRVKPSKEVKVGQEIVLMVAEVEKTLHVRALSSRRGPAPVAQLLYEETVDSRERREVQSQLARDTRIVVGAKPDRRGRREGERFKKGDW